MPETPGIVTYAPLITSAAIGIGILSTLIIFASKIIFRLGGLFTEVTNLSQAVKDLTTAVAQGNEQVREEVRENCDRVLAALVDHRHTDTDGQTIFTVPNP